MMRTKPNYMKSRNLEGDSNSPTVTVGGNRCGRNLVYSEEEKAKKACNLDRASRALISEVNCIESFVPLSKFSLCFSLA